MNIESDKVFGLTGLVNLGNTCFLNSCLQCLSHTYELDALLDKKRPTKNSDETVILQEWNSLRKMMWERNGAISPNRFVSAVQIVAQRKKREVFTGFSQNDICEFLLFIIECIHESISRPVSMQISGNPANIIDEMAIKSYELLRDVYAKEYSELMEMFYGIYVTNILDKKNKSNKSIKAEHFFILDLQLFDATTQRPYATIYDCFEAFYTPELMEGENAWYNEKTNAKEDVYKTTLFWSLPDILVLCLKRFSPDGRRKLQHLVDFPLDNLNLCKYVKGYKSSENIYDLYGICNHMGSPQGGHYTANIRHHVNKQWYHFNDMNCENVSNPTSMITPSAYCLFYRKRK